MQMNENRLYKIYFISCLCLFIIVAYALYRETRREWMSCQKEYYSRASQFAKSAREKEAIKNTPLEIKQIVIEELGKIDRCVTCHMGVDDPDFKNAPEPYRTHPNATVHPFDKFGCTVCHGGQGQATTRDAAHGHVKHWEAPLIPRKYINSSCAKCHVEGDIPGAPELAIGRRLIDEKGCRGCHKLYGSGGNIGSDLNNIGRPGYRNISWLEGHFREPGRYSKGTIMPNFHFSENEITAITMLMLSLTDEKTTSYLASKKIIANKNLGKYLFSEKKCITCHSIYGRGGKIGPDLSMTAKKRKPEWIVDHLQRPKIVAPGTPMPDFGFTADEARSVLAYIQSLGQSEEYALGEIEGNQSREMTRIRLGREVFLKYGCTGCHGPNGERGIRNPNSASGDKIPALTYIKESYSRKEVRRLLFEGRIPEKKDKKGLAPPLYMPSWEGIISESEADLLIDYIFSLMPEEDNW